MADFVLVEGDQAAFQPTFGAAVVVPRPGKLQASGPGTLNGKKLCVAGDEGKVVVPGCTYITPAFAIPGTGTLKIAALAPDQTAKKTGTGGKAVLLAGTTFTAKFEVQVPAKQPVPTGAPIPDPTPQYVGTGRFVTKNRTFRGT
jgi:Contractile injection system spike tip protein